MLQQWRQSQLVPAETAAIQLRPMHAADLPAVLQLERRSQRDPWSGWCFRGLLRRNASCWVYTLNDRLIGFGMMAIDRGWAHIMNLCIAPAFRKQGLGRRLLLHMLQLAHKQGVRRAWLEVRPSNRVAITLYNSLGFEPRQRRRGYYRQSPRGQRDALVMVRRL